MVCNDRTPSIFLNDILWFFIKMYLFISVVMFTRQGLVEGLPAYHQSLKRNLHEFNYKNISFYKVRKHNF